MKRFRKVLGALLLMFAPAFAFAEKSEASLYGDLNTAYQSGAYPAVIEYAVQIEKAYPRSLLLGKCFAYKGESEYRLGRFSNAKKSLKSAVKLCDKDVELQIASWYWLGKTDAALNDDLTALQDLHTAADLYVKNFTDFAPTSEKTNRYYALTILNTGKIFYRNEEYDLSLQPLEYVIQNGLDYSEREYNDSLIQLFDAYNKSGNYAKAVELFETIEQTEAAFYEITVNQVLLSVGEAYEKIGRYRTAYDKYCMVLTGSDSMMASIALQKTYNVASLHPKEVGEEPGKILSNAESTLSEYTTLVSEFWTRLGVDAFNNGDFTKAAGYFDNAENCEDVPYMELIGLYRAEIVARLYLRSAENASKAALEILDSYSEKVSLNAESENYVSYLAAYTKWYAMGEQWLLAKDKGNAFVSTATRDSVNAKVYTETVYWYSLALYHTGSYALASSLLGEEKVEISNGDDALLYKEQMLYARCLAKTGKNTQALKIYEKALNGSYLKDEDRVDYAKVLLASGYLNSAYRQALKVNVPDAWYVAALAAFNKKDWSNAEKYFTKYLTKPGENAAFASFYNGYSQYKLGELLSAYKTLSDFANKNAGHKLCYNARIVAANAAVQNNKYADAAREAEKAIKIASTENERQNAIMLCASIYTDSGDYNQAIQTLRESTMETNDFGIRARYQTAQIYTRKGELDNADRCYADIAQNFSSTSLADESAYRRGELYYTQGQYDAAIQRFNIYLDKFKKGLFVDASSFYLADSLAKTDQTNRAIMQYLVLIQTDADSSYAYSAKKNLVALYRKQQNYNEALRIANSLMDQYTDAARKDNVPEMIAEIQLLVSGVSEDEITLQTEYIAQGGKTTAEGRKLGTELALMKWSKQSTKAEAVGIAEEVYAVQKTKGTDECAWACRTAFIIAQYDREMNYNSVAANLFLEAASFARQCGNDEIAQQALYGACEAFNAAGLLADSKSTAEALATLYPDSSYAKLAEELTNE